MANAKDCKGQRRKSHQNKSARQPPASQQQKREAAALPSRLSKKVVVTRCRQTVNRKSASPIGAVKRGEAPVRRFSRDFACKIASLHEQTAGRAIYGSTSARVQILEKVPKALFRHAEGKPQRFPMLFSVCQLFRRSTAASCCRSWASLSSRRHSLCVAAMSRQ